MIPDDFKQRVREATDLVALVQRGGVALKKVGGVEWRGLCPFHKEHTPSFTVNESKGFFHCFGCAENGDCFDWLIRRQGMGFMDALKQLAKEAGLTVPNSDGMEPRLYRAADTSPRPSPAEVRPPTSGEGEALRVQPKRLATEKFRPLVEGSPAWVYLTGKRCIPAPVLAEDRVCETHSKEVFYRDGQEDWMGIGFVYSDPLQRAKDGRARIEFIKCLNIERTASPREDGTVKWLKTEWRNPDSRRSILFGMEAVPQSARELVICEGEMDALSWRAFGFWAVSVPSGAKSQGWIELCTPWLERFEQIHLSFDEDAAGRSVVAEIAVRLGIERTGMVRLPEKETAAAV